MSTVAVEANLGADTAIESTSIVAAASSQINCGPRPQWWCVDVSTWGQVLDLRAGPRPTPTLDELTGFPPTIPGLFVILEWSFSGPGAAAPMHKRRATLDAVRRSYYVWASSVEVLVGGPASLRSLQPNTASPSYATAAVVFGYFDVGVYPCECPRSPSRGSFTSRFVVPAAGGTRIPVPAGARLVQVQDPAATASYVWGLGTVSSFGDFSVVPGLSDVLVPNATDLIAPVGKSDRTVVATWEVDV